MVITKLKYGLGNQLFQYAVARRLAAKRGVPLKLDLEWFQRPQDTPVQKQYTRCYRLDAFHIAAETAGPADFDHFQHRPLHRFDPRRIRGPWWRFARLHAPQFCRGLRIYECGINFEPRLLRLPGDVWLEGWWFSEGYFQDYAGPLRVELTLRDAAIVEHAAAEVRARRSGHRPLVAVQVRRGDVARSHEVFKDLTDMPYELVSREYLLAAMAVFGDEATFLVFSEGEEGIAWCQANLQARDMHFVRGPSDLHDFSAMSQCDHNIISSSTFGWWAAWLNPNPRKVVVAPRRWFTPQHAAHNDIRSLIPADWLLR